MNEPSPVRDAAHPIAKRYVRDFLLERVESPASSSKMVTHIEMGRVRLDFDTASTQPSLFSLIGVTIIH